jgi:O-acetyl-ADP-ribose deacetylase (regulator of RNase III)
MSSVDEAKKKIADYVRNGLKLGRGDSPVHDVLDLRIDQESPELTKTETFIYQLRDRPDKQIGLVTGDLRHVKQVDVWVNSENTNMQMARHFDRSISSVIRYYGAKRRNGAVTEDIIADELEQKLGRNTTVPPGQVVATGSGELHRSNGVKHVFHAAAVLGQPGRGYTPIGDISMCVRNALELADSDEFNDSNPTSILFPLIGTGAGRGEPERTARELVQAAISHLEKHPPCRITEVYFLVWTERQLAVCQRIFQAAPEVVIM